MKSLVMIFLLTASASLMAAPNFKKLDYQELRAFDTSTLSEKDLKKYNKAWKKAVKKREKIVKFYKTIFASDADNRPLQKAVAEHTTLFVVHKKTTNATQHVIASVTFQVTVKKENGNF